MKTTIRPCRADEVKTLQTLALETFNDAFREMNSEENINTYLQEAFNTKKLSAELTDPGSSFFFLYAEDNLAGYLKINIAPSQTDINDPQTLEVERIYVLEEFQGQGLGAVLMELALQLAQDMGKKSIWLGVWEKNTGAIAFYKKQGFIEAGRHSFRMGDEIQSDWILKREL
jgi:diamine N-acetyltransferase